MVCRSLNALELTRPMKAAHTRLIPLVDCERRGADFRTAPPVQARARAPRGLAGLGALSGGESAGWLGELVMIIE